MDSERRKVTPPKRRDLLDKLTDEQRFELRRYEHFGWELEFVRHPMFDNAMPVMRDRDTGRLALLEPDGTLNHDHNITLRVSSER